MTLQIGQKVYCALYGGREGIVYKIEGKQDPESVKSLGGGAITMGGRAHFGVVFDDGSISHVPESIITGIQWQIYDEIATSLEIDKALAYAEAEKLRRELDKQAEAARQERERQNNLREYGYLLKRTDRPNWSGYRLAAANIRKELKRAFPATSFSVTCKGYAGGDHVSISWVDGPTAKQVEAVTAKYEEGTFDGMADCYDYSRDHSFTGTFGGTKYLLPQRDYTLDGIKKAWREAGNGASIADNWDECIGNTSTDDGQRRYIREIWAGTDLTVAMRA